MVGTAAWYMERGIVGSGSMVREGITR